MELGTFFKYIFVLFTLFNVKKVILLLQTLLFKIKHASFLQMQIIIFLKTTNRKTQTGNKCIFIDNGQF